MAAGDSKGGSDLDVFEGLGKKTSTRAPVSSPRSAPPPPPSLRQAPPAPKPVPPPTATMPSAHAAPSSPPQGPPSRTPPPPPGRAALPPVVPPPSKSAARSPPKAAASSSGMSVKALSTRPAAPAPTPPPSKEPAKAKAGLEMDWDDEEEATHVLDREGSKADALLGGLDNGAAKAVPKQTLVGLSGGAPPGARPPSLPPPPPSASNAYARPPAPPGAQPPPSSAPPPPAVPPPSMRPAVAAAAIPAAPPPQAQTLPSANGAASNFPYQPNTTPLQMPARTSARAQLNPKIEDAPVLPPRPNRMEATALVRPQQRPVGLFAVAAVGLLAVVGTFLFLMPRSGQIAINVADVKGGAVKGLQVSIDGKLQCETAPCLVKDLVSGSHTVKVEAAGYEPPADKAVAIESGKLSGVDFTLTPVAASGGTGIKVTGSQPGEKLYVDDKEIGALPQEIHDLTPGSHKVRVAAGERYAAVEKTIQLSKDEFQDLGAVSLKVIKGRATVTLATQGAKVFLVSGSDKRELPQLPMSIDLDPSKQWSLVATKTGYSDFTQPLNFEDGQAEKSFTVTLDPKTASSATGAVAVAPAPQTYTRPPSDEPPPSRPSRPSHPAEPAHEATHEAPAAAGGEGTLNMNSIPASSVVLDGKPIGNTPQIGITVSAGTHKVTFVNPDQGFKKDVTVTVAAGETKRVHP